MQEALYPWRFEPIFKSALWGGHALRPMLGATASEEKIGEAWLLSDQGDNLSRVIEGPLAGRTLRELMGRFPREILGKGQTSNGRFPLLLKFLDAQMPLSVQVHPSDEQARRMEPGSDSLGKTEAWVILHAEQESLVYAGLRTGVGKPEFTSALRRNTLPDVLHSYSPRVGDCIFLRSGTVHAIGAGLQLFEVQQTSDTTYRLFDWNRVDAKTGKPRELHIEQALACTDFASGPCEPVKPTKTPCGLGEQLVQCEYFTMNRFRVQGTWDPSELGCRIFVCIAGTAAIIHRGKEYPLRTGNVLLLPAALEGYGCVSEEGATLLECRLAHQ